MKKTFILTATLFAVTAGFAQPETMRMGRVGFGIKAGINLSKATREIADESVSTGTKLGLNAGVFVEMPVSTNFSVQPELNFSQMGFEEGEGTTQLKYRLNYLSLPVLAKVGIASSGFNVYAGPQISLLMSGEYEDVNGTEFDIDEDVLKKSEFSGIAGAEFRVPHTGFTISGRYQFGLSNIDETTTSSNSLKNNAATFTVGYRF